ncbi:MAG: GntR family transcriptional regulator [Mycobacteriaceae bacterium]|uniref:GntR family transcriptional regulator n=1 Tax=Corynebacterium sp. TaxID=1720 RepID=UPI003F956607
METPGQARSVWVFEQIKRMIIDGDLRPGDDLRERDLADTLGVSRVPVREALPMLESAGLVKLSPRRSAKVTDITGKDVEDLYDLRSSLEPLTARLAARRVAEGADPAALSEALDAAGVALEEGDDTRFHQESSRLHREIERLASNPLLDTVMASLRERSARLNVVNIGSHARTRHQEHVVLATAIIEGKERLADSVAFSHVELGQARTVQTVLQMYGDQ